MYEANKGAALHTAEAVACAPPKKLWLMKGDVLVMSGRTVHSGAAGRDGKADPRVHAYTKHPRFPKDADATYAVSLMGTGMANMFTLPR